MASKKEASDSHGDSAHVASGFFPFGPRWSLGVIPAPTPGILNPPVLNPSFPQPLPPSTPPVLSHSLPQPLVSSTPPLLKPSSPQPSTPLCLNPSRPKPLSASTAPVLNPSLPQPLMSSTPPPQSILSSTPSVLNSSLPQPLLSSTPLCLNQSGGRAGGRAFFLNPSCPQPPLFLNPWCPQPLVSSTPPFLNHDVVTTFPAVLDTLMIVSRLNEL